MFTLHETVLAVELHRGSDPETWLHIAGQISVEHMERL